MSLRRLRTGVGGAALALAAALASPAMAVTPAEPAPADAASPLHDERPLEAVDSAFRSGALTFAEAQALYAEQAAIRGDYVVQSALDPDAALARYRFMQATAATTLARLTFNRTVRLDLPARLATP